MQVHLIIESAVDIENDKGHLECPNCNMELAKEGTYKEGKTYWINRGKINKKRLDNSKKTIK